MRWVWLSFRPGMSLRPPASMVWVFGPAIAAMSRVLPTPTILPSRKATASASGLVRSRVVTFALRSTMSGAGFISAPRGFGCRAFASAGLVLVAAEHRLRIDDAKAVSAAKGARYTGDCLVGFAARPVALQLKQILQRRHRPRSCLDHAFHGPLMCFLGNIAARIGNHVDLEALIECGECRPDNAHGRPQAREY